MELRQFCTSLLTGSVLLVLEPITPEATPHLRNQGGEAQRAAVGCQLLAQAVAPAGSAAELVCQSQPPCPPLNQPWPPPALTTRHQSPPQSGPAPCPGRTGCSCGARRVAQQAAFGACARVQGGRHPRTRCMQLPGPLPAHVQHSSRETTKERASEMQATA